MRLDLIRDVFTPTTTLGRILVDGKLFGYSCEDEDRGLDAAMRLAELQALKVKAETAIPVGSYVIAITPSQRYGRPMPEVLSVPAFRGIRIHPGNTEADTAGCLLPGTLRDVRKAMVLHSTPAFEWLEARFQECAARGEAVHLQIARDAAMWKGPVKP